MSCEVKQNTKLIVLLTPGREKRFLILSPWISPTLHHNHINSLFTYISRQFSFRFSFFPTISFFFTIWRSQPSPTTLSIFISNPPPPSAQSSFFHPRVIQSISQPPSLFSIRVFFSDFITPQTPLISLIACGCWVIRKSSQLTSSDFKLHPTTLASHSSVGQCFFI